MDLVVLSGSSHPALAAAVAPEIEAELGKCLIDRFPDGEIHVQILADVGRREVFVVQPTGPVPSEHLFELLLISDACRRAGAARVSAVIPYFGYARQNRIGRQGQALPLRMVADLLGTGGIARVVSIDLHGSALESSFPMPLTHLSAAPLLSQWIRAHVGKGHIVVSPDLGAVKLAERYAQALRLPMAIVHKTRRNGAEVSVQGVVGDPRGLAPIVVDDMVSTGGTVAAAVATMIERGCAPEITVVATHGVLLKQAIERLAALPLRRLVTTDSLPQPSSLPFVHEVVTLAPLLAEAISRLCRGGSLSPLPTPL